MSRGVQEFAEGEVYQGTVKRWHEKGGYGFIYVPDHGDIFCHFTALRSQKKTLEEGDGVEVVASFDSRPGKGWHASEATPL